MWNVGLLLWIFAQTLDKTVEKSGFSKKPAKSEQEASEKQLARS
jgi:hypothetical protein